MRGNKDVAPEIINSERFFELWSYSVSHHELLLRSTKSTEFPTRIDVFFKGVEEIHVPTASNGLSIAEISSADVQKLSTLRSASYGKHVRVFAVQGEGFTGYVAALIALWHEDKGEYYDPSFFAPKE